MQHIETVTVGSGGAASITFSAIPDTFTDLYVLVSGRTDIANVAANPRIYPNGSSSNLSFRLLRGRTDTGNVSSFTGVTGFVSASQATANTFGTISFYIPNYRSSAAKSISIDSVQENNGTGFMSIAAGLWDNASAITSLEILGQSTDSWVEHSSFSLYGITAGSDGVTTVS